MYCSNCAYVISDEAFACPKCGQPTRRAAVGPAGPAVPGAKNRVTAAVLALLLGGLGIHKFYLGKTGLGVVYLVFCWTFVPAIVAFVEGIIYLTQDDATFAQRQGVQVY